PSTMLSPEISCASSTPCRRSTPSGSSPCSSAVKASGWEISSPGPSWSTSSRSRRRGRSGTRPRRTARPGPTPRGSGARRRGLLEVGLMEVIGHDGEGEEEEEDLGAEALAEDAEEDDEGAAGDLGIEGEGVFLVPDSEGADVLFQADGDGDEAGIDDEEGEDGEEQGDEGVGGGDVTEVAAGSEEDLTAEEGGEDEVAEAEEGLVGGDPGSADDPEVGHADGGEEHGLLDAEEDDGGEHEGLEGGEARIVAEVEGMGCGDAGEDDEEEEVGAQGADTVQEGIEDGEAAQGEDGGQEGSHRCPSRRLVMEGSVLATPDAGVALDDAAGGGEEPA